MAGTPLTSGGLRKGYGNSTPSREAVLENLSFIKYHLRMRHSLWVPSWTFFSLPSLPSVFSLRKEAVAPLSTLRALGVHSWEFSCLSRLAAVSLRLVAQGCTVPFL